MRGPRFSGLGRDRAFLLFWAGQAISGIGTQVTVLALPLTAAVVLDATALQMGILVAAQQAAGLLIGLPAGAWVDRRRKRPVLIAADLGRAALLGLVPLAHWRDGLSIEQLYVIGAFVGALDTLFEVARAPFLVAVVRRERILEANSKLSQSQTVTMMGGPGLAGVLVQAVTAPVAILVDAVSFVVSAVLLGSVRAREETPPADDGRVGFWREIGEGLRFVAGNRLLRGLAGTRGTWTFFDNVVLAVLVLYVTRELGLSPALLGIVFVGGPMGFFVGSLLSPGAVRAIGFGPAAVWGAVLGSVGSVLYTLAGGPVVVAMAMVLAAELVMGLGAGFYSISAGSLRQIVTPDRLLGRMNASFTVLAGGVAPLGALAGGILGETIGLRPTLVVGAVGGMAGFLWVWFSPLKTMRERPEPGDFVVS